MNFIFDWRVKLKRKINLVKGSKKIKRMRIKTNIKNKSNVLNEEWNWKKIIFFYKRAKKNIRDQNNEDQIEKHNTINLNWMIKLKTNKIFIKVPRKKLKIKRMRTELENMIFGKLRLNDKIENK